jgi:hypothetical protein
LLLLLLSLAEKWVGGSGRLLAIVLVDAHALIRIIRVGTAGPESDRIYVEGIPGLGLLEDKLEAALFTARKVAVDHVRAVRARRAAGWGTELRERCRVLPVLRVVLGFCP